MDWKQFKREAKRVWKFIWDDDSLLSWIVNIVLAFILVKFIIYPGLGLLLGTTHPVVAVVSGSMEHEGYKFSEWWDANKDYYRDYEISEEEFSNYILKNGFNKGDLVVLESIGKIKKGDIIVFRGGNGEPIIHRVVIAENRSAGFFIQTKGDNNRGSLNSEIGIPNEGIIGKAKFKIPYLGWFKVGVMSLFS